MTSSRRFCNFLRRTRRAGAHVSMHPTRFFAIRPHVAFEANQTMGRQSVQRRSQVHATPRRGLSMTATDNRKADHPIDAMFIERWSPRAFTNEEIDEKTLLSFFEAARWAPSASNRQPWRFVYARRGTDRFPVLLDTLDEGNQRWAKNAAALLVGTPTPTPSTLGRPGTASLCRLRSRAGTPMAWPVSIATRRCTP
jgi:hypothetical protein